MTAFLDASSTGFAGEKDIEDVSQLNFYVLSPYFFSCNNFCLNQMKILLQLVNEILTKSQDMKL